MLDSSVMNNRAGDGGGIENAGELPLEGCTIAGNTANDSGGGIFAIWSPAPNSLTAVNCTISDNTVSDPSPLSILGGGIYTSMPTVLTNVTVTANRLVGVNPYNADQGGGLNITTAIPVKVYNSIISGNFGTDGTADDVNGSGTLDPSSSHNLIGGDAMLGPLADNGGPTLTRALRPGSPAIDAGDNSRAVDENGNPLTTDQRGFVRISGATVDIGAYEFQQAKPTNPDNLVAAGSGAGGLPMVKVYNANGGLIASFLAYDPRFRGGVNVTVADVNGDGVPDIITGAGPGGGPHVEVFDGTKLWMTQANGELAPAAVLASFYAYDANFRGGVHVAAGDVTGDGHADIVTGAGAGGGPHVKIFDGISLATMASFYAYAPTFHGGVNVAVGAVAGAGTMDVITGAGAGGGPHVKVFNGTALMEGGLAAAAAMADLLKSFFAYAPTFTGGVSVAVGAVTAAGTADIVTGAGPGIAARQGVRRRHPDSGRQLLRLCSDLHRRSGRGDGDVQRRHDGGHRHRGRPRRQSEHQRFQHDGADGHCQCRAVRPVIFGRRVRWVAAGRLRRLGTGEPHDQWLEDDSLGQCPRAFHREVRFQQPIVETVEPPPAEMPQLRLHAVREGRKSRFGNRHRHRPNGAM